MTMLEKFPIPKRLRDVGFDKSRIDYVACEAEKLNLKAPRAASADDVKVILEAAY